eukprot:1722579-Rhodomonas_salina.1
MQIHPAPPTQAGGPGPGGPSRRRRDPVSLTSLSTRGSPDSENAAAIYGLPEPEGPGPILVILIVWPCHAGAPSLGSLEGLRGSDSERQGARGHSVFGAAVTGN